MPEVTSSLWKAHQLVLASNYFPALVRIAAIGAGKPYSQEMAFYVATRPEVTAAITISISGGIASSVDTALEHLIVNAGAGVDAVISAAVAAFAVDGPQI